MNILTFDIEEWFHLLDFDATRTESEWDRYEVRIYENVDRILDILEKTNSKATFFIIGWIAKKYPEVVKKIAAKYQIGTHTMNHQLVWQQTREEFKRDVVDSIHLLQDITGQKVECFRAPGFSIREQEMWAFDILAEAGIKYDCSVFPAPASHGGMPSYGEAVPKRIQTDCGEIKEFPVVCHNILRKHVVFNGGGYFRLCPYSLIKKWTKQLNGYSLSYIHPRDLDANQPMLENLPLTRRFKSYVGVKTSEQKLRQYLSDFQFIDIAEANAMIDWGNTETIK